MGQKIIPIANRVLIKPVPKKETTDSGIFLPDQQQIQIPRGTVVAVGGTVKEIKVGDFVQWLEEAAVRNMEHDGEPHLVMYDHAIMCKLED
tara:strand:- start:345 stop:617 length:273 start_codon:yes stop_codon:yes gene_type:complete